MNVYPAVRPAVHTGARGAAGCPQRRPQRGSTLLGFVAGLLLGLALALAVALFVTRSDTPLEDRGLQQPAISPALEAERNRNWNPNAALSTRPAADLQPAPPLPAQAAVPAPAAPSASETPAPTAALPDPLGQLVEQRAAATPAPEAAQALSYFVQAGAFASAEEAQAQRARLAMLGFEAQVSARQQDGRTMHRVRLGPYAQLSDAENTSQRLQEQDIETALVRVVR